MRNYIKSLSLNNTIFISYTHTNGYERATKKAKRNKAKKNKKQK